MLIKLLLIFSLVPLLELMLLIEVGGLLGVGATVLLVAGTGIVGISIARNQGLALISDIKLKLNQGQMPKDQLLDGGLLLFGAATLLTPGLLTDTLGFLLIIPFTRPLMRKIVKENILSNFFVAHNLDRNKQDDYQTDYTVEEEEIIDITDYEEIDEDDD
ncbi:MAG: FxsA family protein [Bacillota bacterium]